MPKRPAQLEINLLPKDPFYETVVGKILKWALSVGRYIVIFTELIVIMSFAGRFSLDQRVTNLNTEIFQRQSIIESYGDLETQVKAIQFKTDQYQQVVQQNNIADVFPQLSAITPKDVRLDELNIRQDQVSLRGTAATQNALNLLITNVQVSEDFYEVTVDKIETGDKKDPGFAFQIRATTKPPVAAASNTKKTDKVNVLDRTQGL